MDAIAMARELGKAIQQDERFIRLMAQQQVSDGDKELQELIGQFNLKRIDLNAELNKEEKDQERLNAINNEVREIYDRIMANANMAAYNAAKNELDELVEYVMQIRRGSINGEDPEQIQLQSGCTGSCSTCAGCN